MVNYDDLRRRVAGMNCEQVRALATASGVPFHTLLKIRSGETDNPRIRTVERLHAALEPVAQ
jgi:transcriptional regulator with XRE-family HTH domain